MIYALTWGWEKSQYLTWLANKGLTKYNIKHICYFDKGQKVDDFVMKDLISNNTLIKYKTNFGGGHKGWPDAMQKIKAYRDIINEFNIQENDWIADMDDDTYMASDAILKLLTPDRDLVGFQQSKPWTDTKIGKFGHMSGQVIFMRGGCLIKMLNQYSDEDLSIGGKIQSQHFRSYNICEMWDVVTSYLMMSVGAVSYDMSKDIKNDDPEGHFLGTNLGDWFHLCGVPTKFLGKHLPFSRYSIPLVLKEMGLI